MFGFEPTSNVASPLHPSCETFGWNNDGNWGQGPAYYNAPLGQDTSLGQEFLMNDAGVASPVYAAATGGPAGSVVHSAAAAAPAPTVVGPADGLRIDLVWGRSVAHAPSGFRAAITNAAEEYATLFTSSTGAPEFLKIRVGYGKIDGSPLAPDALGESESYGYLTNYATVTNALDRDNFVPQSASNDPTSSQFFVTSADAKTLDLIDPASHALDGFVGFSALSGGYSWNTGSNGYIGALQFDLQAVAEHEISEVMGRIGAEGASIGGEPSYTPLDLFNYASPGVLELSPNGGRFSVNDEVSPLGLYNDAAANGGDIADWASQSDTLPANSPYYDAYDAFTAPGVVGVVSVADVVEDAALGYRLTPAGLVAVS